MLKSLALATLLLATPIFATTTLAQAPMPQGMAMPPAAPDQTAASKAFKAAMDRMMADMAQPTSGDPDQTFVAGMLPHHKGAVEMAQVELQYGKDPALKRLARNIIKAQDSEIVFMRDWQQKHPAPKPHG